MSKKEKLCERAGCGRKATKRGVTMWNIKN